MSLACGYWPSYSSCRDRINLGPNFIRYQMWCSQIRHLLLKVFARLNPHSLIWGKFGHSGHRFLHQLTMESSLFEPGSPVISIVLSLSVGWYYGLV